MILRRLFPQGTNVPASEEDRRWFRHLNGLSRDELEKALAAKRGKVILTPSYGHPGEESACPRCRDLEWIGIPPKDHAYQNDMVPCPDCKGDEVEEKRLAAAGIPRTRRHQTLGSYRWSVHPKAQEAHAAAESLCGVDGNPFLALTGPKGCGKTHLMRAIGMRMIEQGFGARYYRGAELEALLRSTQRPNATVELDAIMAQLATIDVLMVDDLWAQQSTEWGLGQWEDLIDRRYDSMAITVLASNLPSPSIERLSGRIYSRLRDTDVSTWVDMAGVNDYRQGRA